MSIVEKVYLVILLFLLAQPAPSTEWAIIVHEVLKATFAVLFVIPTPSSLFGKKGDVS